ncbi:MAG TPA: hypothetical protein VKE24_03080 [Candidatus Acidoferrales bacterium]|nr:hypothetical protein [Candidatus Acidoferrales bacterium]
MPSDGKTLTRLVVDNPATAETVPDTESLVTQKPKSLKSSFPTDRASCARATSRLGDSNININYAYGGLEEGTNAPVVIFGVAEVARAVTILDQLAAAARA